MIAFRRGSPTGTLLAAQTGMRAAVLFATREGHTRRIAERIALDLRAHGTEVDVFDVRTGGPVSWPAYSAAVVAASVHLGRHEPEMIAFVRRHRTELERLSAAFISVTLSEAGAENLMRSDAERERAAADVERMIDVFVHDTGWRPRRTLPVAGALTYSRYNIFVRFIMKRIARTAGAPTDTSRDYEFTNWPALDRFVAELAAKT
jgi:menaquinone-dependent protoporphyrinogen oxidase